MLQTITIEAMGVPEIRAGSIVPVKIGAVGDLAVSRLLLAEKVTHEEVTELMGANAERLAKILLQLVYAYQEC